MSQDILTVADDSGGGLRNKVKDRLHDKQLIESKGVVVGIEAREHSTCVMIAHGDIKQCMAHGASPQPNTM